MSRLQAAARTQGIKLQPGWRVEVRIRKNGTSKGTPLQPAHDYCLACLCGCATMTFATIAFLDKNIVAIAPSSGWVFSPRHYRQQQLVD